MVPKKKVVVWGVLVGGNRDYGLGCLLHRGSKYKHNEDLDISCRELTT